MKDLVLESYGKINLGLDVLYKRNDGYHEINTIMQQISLKDTISIKDMEENIIIESDNREIPLGPENLVYKAWESLRDHTGINRGVHIQIKKKIPIGGGLAGGSANAASVLKGLNQLWDLGLSHEELRAMGKDLGADIPYCITGGTVLAKGIGDKLTKLKSFGGKDLLLINPGIFISTKTIYEKLDLEGKGRINIGRIITSMENDDLPGVGRYMENIMEKVVMEENPIIGEIKKDMIQYGALGSLMSGSGPTVFGLFQDPDRLDYCYRKLKNKYTKGLAIKGRTI